MVNGEDKIWHWTGGITTFASATANTITKKARLAGLKRDSLPLEREE